jgi:CO dehydrogenase maturation factor
MAAGIEHLSRATARAVDRFIVVVEPGSKSIDTALRVRKMAQDIGVRNIAAVGNKIRGEKDIQFLRAHLPDFDFLGFIPYDQTVIDADISDSLAVDSSSLVKSEVQNIYRKLVPSSP